jgi:hypothetical protein
LNIFSKYDKYNLKLQLLLQYITMTNRLESQNIKDYWLVLQIIFYQMELARKADYSYKFIPYDYNSRLIKPEDKLDNITQKIILMDLAKKSAFKIEEVYSDEEEASIADYEGTYECMFRLYINKSEFNRIYKVYEKKINKIDNKSNIKNGPNKRTVSPKNPFTLIPNDSGGYLLIIKDSQEMNFIGLGGKILNYIFNSPNRKDWKTYQDIKRHLDSPLDPKYIKQAIIRVNARILESTGKYPNVIEIHKGNVSNNSQKFRWHY